MVLVLHGGRDSADDQRVRTELDDLAVAERFSGVFAEGSEGLPGRQETRAHTCGARRCCPQLRDTLIVDNVGLFGYICRSCF